MAGLGQVLVEQSNPLHGACVKPCAAPPSDVAEGEVVVHIVKFVLTANTVTYALMGKLPGFATWQHYPYEDPTYAKSPCWGTGVVTVSRCPGVARGSRIHGYFPMSPWCVLQPTGVTAEGAFMDGAVHRTKLLAPYRSYKSRAPTATADEEDLRSADALLFGTGWGMAQQAKLADVGSRAALLTSASSRTAITAAFSAQYHKIGQKVIGLTSKANEAFVKGTGLYDLVCTYDSVQTLPRERVIVFDMAGSPSIQADLRAHYGSNIAMWAGVGNAHVTDGVSLGSTKKQGEIELCGGAPSTPFFVFAALKAAGKAYGKAGMQKMLDSATEAYVEWKLPNFKTTRCFGAQATLAVWNSTVANSADPAVTYVCSLWPTEELAEPGGLGSERSRL